MGVAVAGGRVDVAGTGVAVAGTGVAVAGKFLLVGVGDGPMTVLAELDGERLTEAQRAEAAAPGGIGAALRRVLGGRA